MLKIELNKDGQVFIRGDRSSLSDLRRHLNEVIEEDSPSTKTYQDFKWNAWETKEPSVTVTIQLG